MPHVMTRRSAALALAGAALTACTAPAEHAASRGPLLVAGPDAPACTAEYSAVLDVAVLARSYGAGAGLFMDALGSLMEQLEDCMAGRGLTEPRDRAVQIRAQTASARRKLIHP